MPPSQIGVAPEHWVLSVHWTHWWVAPLHFCPVGQSTSASHCTQVVVGTSQIGVGAMQFAFVEQPLVQVCVVVSHFPFGPTRHCASDVHCTHLVLKQTGNAAVHAEKFVLLHCTHLPPTHAGAGGLVTGQAAVAVGLPVSPLHGTQVSYVGLPTVLSQMGLLRSVQSPFERQPAHLFVVVSHCARPSAAQRVRSSDVHSTHWPAPPTTAVHAGRVVVGHSRPEPVP